MKKQKKPTLAEKKQEPLCDELKRRILDVKKRLPTSGITSLIAYKYPELDNVKGKSLVSMVLQLRKTDKEVTEKLEHLADTLNELDKLIK